MSKSSRWWACETPHRPLDDHVKWHDDECEDCTRRKRLDPDGEGVPTRPSRASMEAAEARILAGKAREKDPDIVRRWRLYESDGEARRPRAKRVTRRDGSAQVESLRRAADDLAVVLAVVEFFDIEQPAHDHAVDRMRDARPGPGAAAYDGAVRAPTAESKEPPGLGIDAGGEALRETNAAARQVAAGAATLRRRVEGWMPHDPTPGVRQRPESGPECAWTRAKLGKHEPVYRTGRVADTLPQPMALCRWVYDFVRDNGRLPNGQEMTVHDRGETVRVKAS